MILYGIAIKSASRAPMQLVGSAEVNLGQGVVGDWRGKGGFFHKRQVTLISLQQWEEVCKELGQDLPWTTRRANLCISGLEFEPDDVGAIIRIGPSVALEVTGETEPCKRMDEAHPGLKQALASKWRGGVTCKVINAGTIQVNNQVGHSAV